MGGDIPAPERTWPEAKDVEREGQASRRPGSLNPLNSELSYEPADEARDVSSRLEVTYATAIGEGVESRAIDLEEAFRISQRSGREFLNAEEDYIFSAIRLLIERHLWGPRFFNDTSAVIAGSGDDGTFDSALRIVNELRATQRLPYGGEVEARWLWDATEQLRDQATGEYRQSSEIALDANIPLLRGAGLVAQEDIIQAERNLVYAARDFEDFRRRFLVDIASDYFDLVLSTAQIANQVQQLESLRASEVAAQARYDAGRIRAFDLSILRSQILQAESSLASQRDSYILSLDRFKIRLGLPVDEVIRIQPLEMGLAEPEVTPTEASRLALLYRLDLQNRRDQVDDARRGVSIARNQILPDLNLTAGVGIPTDPDDDVGHLSFDPDELNYSAGITFGLPLDREIERLQLRQAVIQAEQAQREYERFRDEVTVTSRQAARAIDLSRQRMTLAAEGVVTNERRLEELKLRESEVEPQKIVDAEIDLLNARNDYDQALADLRVAVLQYLLQSGQLRVKRDGNFDPPPGMMPERPDEPPAGNE